MGGEKKPVSSVVGKLFSVKRNFWQLTNLLPYFSDVSPNHMPLVRVKASGGLSTDICRLAAYFWMMYEGGRASQVLRLLTHPTKPYLEARCHLKAYRLQASPQRQTTQNPKIFSSFFLWDSVLGPASLDSDLATVLKVSGSKPTSYSMSNVFFTRGIATRAWRWAFTPIHPIPRLIISGVMPPLPECGQEQPGVGVSSSKLDGGIGYHKWIMVFAPCICIKLFIQKLFH